MSSARTEFTLALSADDTLVACATAIAECGWQITQRHAVGLLCQEPPAGAWSFTNPATVELTLGAGGAAGTAVTLLGSNLGFGPIQSNHVKKQLAALREAILRRAPGAEPAATVADVATAPAAEAPGAGLWDWVRGAAGQAAQFGADYLRQRAFIESLFQMTPEQAYQRLQQHIATLGEGDYHTFTGALAGMIGEAQQALAQAQQSNSWGSSFEDQTAQFMAEAQSGFPSSGRAEQAAEYLRGLYAVQQFAAQFHQQRGIDQGLGTAVGQPKAAAATPQPRPAAEPPPQPDALSTEDIERALEAMVHSGEPDSALIQQLLTMNDPQAMERVLAKLQALGADEGPSPSLNIADHYQPGDGSKFSLSWPLSPHLPLPVPFDELDRETQFHVLFGEWSRRELEGNQALASGDLDQADSVFRECLARAEQLDVAELRARSCEGMMRLAQRQGDRDAERQWLDAALDARGDA